MKFLKELTGFEKLIFFLSLYVIVQVYVETVFTFSERTLNILLFIDTLICFVFLGDFTYGLVKTDDKWKFLKTRWINAVASIPTIGFLRYGRIFRIIRILRLVRSLRQLHFVFKKHDSLSSFQNIAFLTIVILLLTSISFYQFEKMENEYINNMGDSVWWSLITITTLGFVSDVEPVSMEGKVISVALIFSGLLLFGTFISMVTDYFILDDEIEERLHRIETHYTVIEYKLDDIAQKIENLSSEE